jgi:hypothetical protein
MKHKSEARQRLIEFIHLIENQHKTKVRAIRSDNGPEFIMPQFYASKCIIHQTSCVETPQQNARVERKHQHILNVARALLFQAHLPKSFWSYAVLHAIFLINRIPTVVLKDKSPYEILHNALPDLTHLKVFGSLAYATTLQANRTKLSHRGRKCIYLGHKQNVKGAILYDLNNREIFVSRHVTHHDHILPYQSSNQIPWHYHTDYTALHHPDHLHSLNDLENIYPIDHASDNNEPTNPDPPLSDDCSPIVPSDNIEPIQTHTSDEPIASDTHNDLIEPIDTPDTTTPQNTSPQNTNTSRPVRIKHSPAYLTDYVCNTSADLSKSSSKSSKYPICDYHTFSNLSASYHA